ARSADRRGPGGRSCPRHRPPGRETGERLRHLRRASKASRLRHRKADSAPVHRGNSEPPRDHAHPGRPRDTARFRRAGGTTVPARSTQWVNARHEAAWQVEAESEESLMSEQTMNRGARYAVAGTALGAVGASLVAAAASLCCVGPAVVAVLGASGAVAAAGFAPYRPYLLVFAFALLGWGFLRSSRPWVIEGATCAPTTG